MEFKITKFLPNSKEELPPINRPTRSATSQLIKVIKKNFISTLIYYNFSEPERVK